MVVMAPVASVLFLVTLVTSILAFRDPELKFRFLLNPARFVYQKKYYTIVSSGLIHADVRHLLFNMLTFYYFAFYLEAYMAAIQSEIGLFGSGAGQMETVLTMVLGHGKFLIIYLASLIFSDIPTIMKHKDNPAYSCLGASGAISGVVVAMVCMEPTLEIWGFIPGWLFAIVYLVGSYMMGRRGMGNINHDAHFWGGITGLILTIAFFPRYVFFRFSEIFSQLTEFF